MDEIVYYDRYQDKMCVEKVYGDGFLRWTYGSLGGKLALAALVKRACFSHWYGWRMDRARSRRKIAPFLEEYELDPREFVLKPEEFANFNEFFFRRLKPAARPIDASPSSIVFLVQSGRARRDSLPKQMIQSEKANKKWNSHIFHLDEQKLEKITK